MKLDLSKLTTELRNDHSKELSQLTAHEIVALMNQEDETVSKIVKSQSDKIACVIEGVVESFTSTGRLIYMGAGTSGRLGVLDAVECPPTFGVDPTMVLGLIAGGDQAFIHAVEGAEDDYDQGKQDLVNISLNSNDYVIGIAASGRTPYVTGGLDYANSLNCKTASIACNANSVIGKHADIAIEAVTGPEVLTGSTRLKAATAQKMILNMISTGAMIGMGKTYQNLMIDVMQTNDKLRLRAQNIVMEATGISRTQAEQSLIDSNYSVKHAIVMNIHACTLDEALQKLTKANGHISAIEKEEKK